MDSLHKSSFRLAVVVLVGTLVASAGQAQPYLTEVTRWKNQDAADAVPTDPILFLGSSSIRRWEQVTRDFADYNVIQRGLGGAQFDDINNYISGPNSIVLKYNPKAIVVWAGTNDLAAGSDGNEVTADYSTFVNAVLAAQPDVDIFYLGIMPTPGRQGNRPKEDVANANIAAIAAGNSKLHYIDLPTAFAPLNPYGGADFLNKFVDDIHLNRAGYDFWTSIIRPEIEAVVAPNKVYAANPNSPQPGERILFDFGPRDTTNGRATLGPDVNGNHWNNWYPMSGGLDILTGEHVGSLVTTGGRVTPVSLTLTAQFESNGRQNGGLLSPSSALLGDLAIATATEDYFFSTADGVQGGGNDDDGGGFMLSGLDRNLSYNFRFFGTRDSTETRITEYRLFGADEHVATLQTSGNNIGTNGVYDGNDDEVVVFENVRTDEFGQIFFDQTLLQGSFAYLGLMEITVNVPEPSALLLAATCLAGWGFSGRRIRRSKSAL